MSTTIAKTTASSANPEEKMAPPTITLLEKKSPTNGHRSPAQTGKTTPSSTEKKPQINGHASPLHVQTNSSNKAILEGYMKTDDRVRLAKERREERERSLAAREQVMKEKERRAQLQYERTLEERCRRLEEQRLREDQRRAAVEEKRRHQLEEERERLEARMKKSLERSLQLEQRSRRWGRGYPGAGDCENASLPSAASAFSHGIASPIPAVSESAPCSPHRSPYRMDHSRVVLQGSSQSTPNTPKKQRLQKYRNASPGYGSPLRRSESPAAVKQATSPTSKVVSNLRTHSPNNLQQNSPVRQNANLKGVKKADEMKEKHNKVSKNDSPLRSVQTERNSADSKGGPPQGVKVNMIEKFESPERKNKGVQPNVCVQEGDKKKDTTLCTSSGKLSAGTTNEEEATRLLAERRRLARALKEHEEKKRAQEEESVKKEQLKKPIALQQEAKVEAPKEEIKKFENVVLRNDNVNQVNGENEQQIQNDNEAKVLTPEEALRQQQERDLQKQHEEEERQLRKKRIEEIMKRTRKGEGDMKVEESAGADTEVSRQQTLHVSKAEVNGESKDKVTKPSVTPLPLRQLTPPVIKLAPLEVSRTSSGDEVQSMEVSPVSKEELISIPEFSPVNDGPNSNLSNSKALEDLIDLTGSLNPRLSPQNRIGDCNQNLIQGVVSPITDSQLVRKSPPSSNKLTVK
ncbi:MAP7 domain-containing protein 2a isoform X4 [Eucyclogobius newberryi]|uniref:MAP7 domain-containing protein 2a isoform X4 n=1 Tax=Eucyclogobius newberryi TaxID=166745 RepID=UPI003B5D0102